MRSHPSVALEELHLEQILDRYAAAMTEDLRRLLRYPSLLGEAEPGAPFGPAIAEALQFILDLCAGWGFKVENHQGYAGTVDYSAGLNTPRRTVGILTHVDVVPAGGGWVHHPFGGDLDQGVIYGRGAVDDKGPLMACLYAQRALRESGLPLPSRIRHIIGCDEESGFRCLTHYFAHHEKPELGFSPDGHFPVICWEKGIIHGELALPLPSGEQNPTPLRLLEGGSAPNMVADRATAFLRGNQEEQAWLRRAWEHHPHQASLRCEEEGDGLRFTALGRSAHGSTPEEGENAIALLLSFLTQLNRLLPPLVLAPLCWMDTLFCQDHYGEACGLACRDESGPLTLTPTRLAWREDQLILHLDLRYPIHQEGQKLVDRLSVIAAEVGGQFRPGRIKEPLAVGPEEPVVQTLLAVYRQTTGDRQPPLAIGGGTYARTMEHCVAYGPGLPGREYRAHMGEEAISQADLLLLAKIYAKALYRLALL